MTVYRFFQIINLAFLLLASSLIPLLRQMQKNTLKASSRKTITQQLLTRARTANGSASI